MTAQKLTELGFENVFSDTIARTRQRMHEQIACNPEIAKRVSAEIRQENPNAIDVDAWVTEKADALHRDYTKALVAPFKAIAGLF